MYTVFNIVCYVCSYIKQLVIYIYIYIYVVYIYTHTHTHTHNFTYVIYTHMGFSGYSDGKESDCNVGDLGSVPGFGRFPVEGRATHSIFLPGEFHGQRTLAGYSPWDHNKSGMASDFHTHAYAYTFYLVCM